MNKIFINKVVIRFSGDSGDGIQLMGDQFSHTSVISSKNDILTFLDFPAEIRSPAGSLSGVSAFQISISDKKIYSIEESVDLLVAFNPAALKKNIYSLKDNGILIIDSDTFTEKNLKRAGYFSNPLYKKDFSKYKVISISITKLTYERVKSIIKVTSKAKKCKNFFMLGVICWLYDRDLNPIIDFLESKFGKNDIFLANKMALESGYNYGDTFELISSKYFINSINKKDNNLIKISGNKAFVSGALTTSYLLGKKLFSANYPITPASDIMHYMSIYLSDNIKVIQLEDEIASINAIIGASYGGSLSFTSTSGPGLDLMQEGIGLSIMAELPIVLINVQRSGPSTGIPTKSEQTDLFASIYGRHGESPSIVLAPKSPSDCFFSVIEAFILSQVFLGPVIILSDSNLANSSETWNIPSIPYIKSKFKLFFQDYLNFDWTLFKKNLTCIGGLEMDEDKKNVSYDPDNHHKMVIKRNLKFCKVKKYFTSLLVFGKKKGDILLISWGSVYGILRSVYEDIIKNNSKINISFICLKHLNPIHPDLDEFIYSFKKIFVIEENLGQLHFILKSKYLVNMKLISQVTGKPFNFYDLKKKILENI